MPFTVRSADRCEVGEESEEARLDPGAGPFAASGLRAEACGGAGEDEIVERAEPCELLARSTRRLSGRGDLAEQEGEAEIVEPRREGRGPSRG